MSTLVIVRVESNFTREEARELESGFALSGALIAFRQVRDDDPVKYVARRYREMSAVWRMSKERRVAAAFSATKKMHNGAMHPLVVQAPSSGDDLRVNCRICFKNGKTVPANFVAPQHTGGNEDEPATWIPICASHVEGWYLDLDEDERLPMFPLQADEQEGR